MPAKITAQAERAAQRRPMHVVELVEMAAQERKQQLMQAGETHVRSNWAPVARSTRTPPVMA